MILQRPPFVFFCGGFATALLVLAMFYMLFSKVKLHTKGIFLCWSIYISIQIVHAWMNFELTAVKEFTYVVSTSTLFYTVVLCAILYISVQRVVAIKPTRFFQVYVKNFGIALVVVVFVARTARTILVYLQNTGDSTTLEASNLLQLATFFPLIAFRLLLDITSIAELYKLKRENTQTNKVRSFRRIMASLSFEIFMGLVSITNAFLEALAYTGPKPAYMDWVLISWSLYALLEQRELYLVIFGFTPQSSHQVSATGSTLANADPEKGRNK